MNALKPFHLGETILHILSDLLELSTVNAVVIFFKFLLFLLTQTVALGAAALLHEESAGKCRVPCRVLDLLPGNPHCSNRLQCALLSLGSISYSPDHLLSLPSLGRLASASVPLYLESHEQN